VNRPPNHIVAGFGFIIVCMVVALAIYLGLTADRRAPGNVATAQPAIDNTITTDIAPIGEAEEHALGRDPDHLEYAGEVDEANASAATDLSNGAVQRPIASACRGYWIGKDFAVTLLPSRGSMVASLYSKEPRPGDANPLVERVTTADPPYPDYQGSYDADHLSVAFANIASIDMTCGEKTARDEEGGDMQRIDKDSLDVITVGWPRQ
jgi:hypothetical protein